MDCLNSNMDCLVLNMNCLVSNIDCLIFKHRLIDFKHGLFGFKHGLLGFKHGLLGFKHGLLDFMLRLIYFKHWFLIPNKDIIKLQLIQVQETANPCLSDFWTKKRNTLRNFQVLPYFFPCLLFLFCNELRWAFDSCWISGTSLALNCSAFCSKKVTLLWHSGNIHEIRTNKIFKHQGNECH